MVENPGTDPGTSHTPSEDRHQDRQSGDDNGRRDYGSRHDAREWDDAKYSQQTGGNYANRESGAAERYDRDVSANTQRGGRRMYYDTRRRKGDSRRDDRTRDPCENCGRWCERDRYCPALNKRCFRCHQLDHFVAQCPRQ